MITTAIYQGALERGLSIIPIPPREKGCKLERWPELAVNSASIMEGKDDWNYGVVANHEFCILDVDDWDTFQTLGVKIPVTYTVATSRGRHFYFRHTDKSRQLGSKSAGIFDFQADRKYVVGEGSTHPSGHVYICLDSSPIVEIPNTLVDALDKYVNVRKVQRKVEGLKSGDRQDMLDYAGRIFTRTMKDGDQRDEMLEMLQAKNEADSEVPLSDGDLQRMVQSAFKSWEPVGDAGPRVVIGRTAVVESERWAVMPVEQLLQEEIPERIAHMKEDDQVVLYANSLNQIVSWRGIGKTNFALGIADALAGGKKLIHFWAVEPRRVLFLDGELPKSVLQERAKGLVSSEAYDNLIFFSGEMLRKPRQLNLLDDRDFSDLQRALDETGAEVLILDSQSTLMRGDSLESVFQEKRNNLLIALRMRGLDVIETHHTGKQGLQRGLSKNDDILDLQMFLRKVQNWEPGDGLEFEMGYEKIRHHAQLEKGYIVSLQDGQWVRRTADGVAEMLELQKAGKSEREIADELGIDRNKVHRALAKAGLAKLNAKVNKKAETT